MIQTYTWIQTHLEEDITVSIPKHEVYDEYRLFCDANHFEKLCVADFGKAMKHIFPGVKPRRLGQRGNSKYCYSGLRKRVVIQVPELPLTDTVDMVTSVRSTSGGGNSESSLLNLLREWAERALNRKFHSALELVRFLVDSNQIGSSIQGMSSPTLSAATETSPNIVTLKNVKKERPLSVTFAGFKKENVKQDGKGSVSLKLNGNENGKVCGKTDLIEQHQTSSQQQTLLPLLIVPKKSSDPDMQADNHPTHSPFSINSLTFNSNLIGVQSKASGTNNRKLSSPSSPAGSTVTALLLQKKQSTAALSAAAAAAEVQRRHSVASPFNVQLSLANGSLDQQQFLMIQQQHLQRQQQASHQPIQRQVSFQVKQEVTDQQDQTAGAAKRQITMEVDENGQNSSGSGFQGETQFTSHKKRHIETLNGGGIVKAKLALAHSGQDLKLNELEKEALNEYLKQQNSNNAEQKQVFHEFGQLKKLLESKSTLRTGLGMGGKFGGHNCFQPISPRHTPMLQHQQSIPENGTLDSDSVFTNSGSNYSQQLPPPQYHALSQPSSATNSPFVSPRTTPISMCIAANGMAGNNNCNNNRSRNSSGQSSNGGTTSYSNPGSVGGGLTASGLLQSSTVAANGVYRQSTPSVQNFDSGVSSVSSSPFLSPQATPSPRYGFQNNINNLGGNQQMMMITASGPGGQFRSLESSLAANESRALSRARHSSGPGGPISNRSQLASLMLYNRSNSLSPMVISEHGGAASGHCHANECFGQMNVNSNVGNTSTLGLLDTNANDVASQQQQATNQLNGHELVSKLNNVEQNSNFGQQQNLQLQSSALTENYFDFNFNSTATLANAGFGKFLKVFQSTFCSLFPYRLPGNHINSDPMFSASATRQRHQSNPFGGYMPSSLATNSMEKPSQESDADIDATETDTFKAFLKRSQSVPLHQMFEANSQCDLELEDQFYEASLVVNGGTGNTTADNSNMSSSGFLDDPNGGGVVGGCDGSYKLLPQHQQASGGSTLDEFYRTESVIQTGQDLIVSSVQLLGQNGGKPNNGEEHDHDDDDFNDLFSTPTASVAVDDDDVTSYAAHFQDCDNGASGDVGGNGSGGGIDGGGDDDYQSLNFDPLSAHPIGRLGGCGGGGGHDGGGIDGLNFGVDDEHELII